MNRTKIPWALNPDGSPGYTLNPITGCLNGCTYCYARRLANTRLKARYLANKNVAPRSYGVPIVEDIFTMDDPFWPRFWPERIGELIKRKQQLMDGEPKPKGIFVCDMSDLFGVGVPEEWTRQIMDAIWDNDEYDRFYLLTKQPQNLAKFSPFPDNCWVGATATNLDMFAKVLWSFREIKTAVKYVSFEPLLGAIRQGDMTKRALWNEMEMAGIKWVIIGAQTRPTVYPKIEWVEDIVEACDNAKIPVFLKDNLMPMLLEHAGDKNLTYHNHGQELFLRQEMPVIEEVSNVA